MKGRRGDNGHGKVDEFVDFIETARQRAADGPSPDFPAGPTEPLMPGGDLPDLRPLLVGYEILERIDRGGQAVVYRAVQAKPRRQVAIKIMLGGATASADQRRRFESEVEMISRLQHPNLVTIHDSMVVDNCFFYTMPYVNGARIDDHVLLHDRSVEQIVGLMIKICRAINHCHQKGVIHRDIKPSNILVDGDGEPHLIDFGLARDMGSTRDPSRTYSISGQVIGTLYYLSPEQAAGRSKSADTRTDVYGLGLTLYQLLTQQFPYKVEGSPEEVRQRIIEQPPISVQRALMTSTVHSKVRSEVAGSAGILSDVDAVIRRALEKEPERRYQTAALLAEDLERCLRGEPVTARSGNRVYRMRKWVRRHRVAAITSGVIAATIAAALVTVTIAWRRSERALAQSAAALDRSNRAVKAYRDVLMARSLRDAANVARDAGQMESARIQYEKAVELIPVDSTEEPELLEVAADCNLFLAYRDLTHERFKQYGSDLAYAAIKRAEIAASKVPYDTPNHLILHAKILALKGRVAELGRVFPVALAMSCQSRQLREQSGARSNAFDGRLDLANNCRTIGWFLDQLGFHGEALPEFCDALSMASDTARLRPEDGEAILLLANCMNNVGTWHMRNATVEDDLTAMSFLDEAEAVLKAGGEAGSLLPQARQAKVLLQQVRANKAIIQRNAKNRLDKQVNVGTAAQGAPVSSR